jgi:4-hydroxy-2-oxoheptanedioate aldolase
MLRPNRTKAKLLENQPAFGLIHALAHPPVAEMIGLAGYDFIVIDGEHGLGDLAAHLACLQAVAATPATAILRLASKDLAQVRRSLDLGIEGVMVPDVRDGKEAKAIAAACFHPPRGTRGFSAATIRASDYGLNAKHYVASDSAQLLLCLMIESARGVENVRRIAETDGVDVIQVGPFDLSYDLGLPGQFEHPQFLEALDRIEAGVKAAGKQLGGVPLPGLPLETALERGYRLITLGADVPLLASALKGAIPGQTGSGA